MSNNRHSFARDFFSRPENDDTIEQFKKEYMASMKNYQLAMEGKNRDIQSPSNSYMNENDNYLVNGSVKRTKNNNNNNNNSIIGNTNNHNSVSSRLSSTATLSFDDHQDLLILKNEVKSLLESRDKADFDKINLKALLNNFDLRLNNLESLILKTRDNKINNKFDQPSLPLSSSYRPVSYGSVPQNKYYWNKDENYDYMLKDQLRRNGYKYKNTNHVNRGDLNRRGLYSHRSSDPIDYSPTLHPYHRTVSTKYLHTPQRKYNYDHEYSKYSPPYSNIKNNNNNNNNNNNSDDARSKYQRNYSLYRDDININNGNKSDRNENDILYDDISTIDILNRRF